MVKKLYCSLHIEIGYIILDEIECYCEHKVDEPDIVLDVPLLEWTMSKSNEAKLDNGVTEATSAVDALIDESRKNCENFKNTKATTDFHTDDGVVLDGYDDELEEAREKNERSLLEYRACVTTR
ncbi:conserved hypothetical protein [Ricinus communis]|uniref:Uncharacterized protein n=1 Tax=Ricinus communis TaxID=3988 RepID=B9SLZ0_RICCO|nr:conserved hypothetical protein [Ricinus communis]